MTTRSGKEYKSQPVSEEGMEAVIKALMEDRQKREQELMTQHAAEESRRAAEESIKAQRRTGSGGGKAPRRTDSVRAARRSVESGAERNAGAYANYGGNDEDIGGDEQQSETIGGVKCQAGSAS